MRCHMFLGANPEEHRAFMFQKLGEEKYIALMKRAKSVVKRNRERSYIEVKKLWDCLSKKQSLSM